MNGGHDLGSGAGGNSSRKMMHSGDSKSGDTSDGHKYPIYPDQTQTGEHCLDFLQETFCLFRFLREMTMKHSKTVRLRHCSKHGAERETITSQAVVLAEKAMWAALTT